MAVTHPPKTLSVIIPAFNEERRLGPTLGRVRAYLAKRRLSHEVLVVDDGSTDGTLALAKGLAKSWKDLRVLSLGQNQGKGAAVRAGVLLARGRQLLFSDADLSTPIEELDRLQPWLAKGYPVVIGSRALDRGLIRVRQPFYREAAGRAFNRLARLLLLAGLGDTQCGFKLFDAAAGRRLFALQRVPRFGFDIEFLYLARKAGLPVKEVAVRWENSPETKVRPFRDGARTFLDLALIRLYDQRGYYRSLDTPAR